MFLTVDEVSVFEKIHDARVVIGFGEHDFARANVVGDDVNDAIEKFFQSHVHPRIHRRAPRRGVISDTDPVSVFTLTEC